jgi:hypothetical protein
MRIRSCETNSTGTEAGRYRPMVGPGVPAGPRLCWRQMRIRHHRAGTSGCLGLPTALKIYPDLWGNAIILNKRQLCARMKRAVNLFQPVLRYMGVNLSRRDVGMPQHELH